MHAERSSPNMIKAHFGREPTAKRFLCLGREPEEEQLSPRFVEACHVDAAVRASLGSTGGVRLNDYESAGFAFEMQHQLNLWQLLLGGVFLHSKLGFVRSSNGMSPVDESLKRLGIDDEFIESLCRTMREFGSGILFSTPRNPLSSVQANSWGVISTARLATFSAGTNR